MAIHSFRHIIDGSLFRCLLRGIRPHTHPDLRLRRGGARGDFAREFGSGRTHQLDEVRAAPHRVEERALKVQAGEAASAVLRARAQRRERASIGKYQRDRETRNESKRQRGADAQRQSENARCARKTHTGSPLAPTNDFKGGNLKKSSTRII